MKKRQNKLNLGLGFNKTDLVEKELIERLLIKIIIFPLMISFGR